MMVDMVTTHNSQQNPQSRDLCQ